MEHLVAYIESSIPVVAVRVSNMILTGFQVMTTQKELSLIISAEVLMLILLLQFVLSKWFAKTDYLSETIESVIMRLMAFLVLVAGFLILTLVTQIVTELFDTSPLRWNDLVTLLFLVFSFIFLLIEKVKREQAAHKKPS